MTDQPAAPGCPPTTIGCPRPCSGHERALPLKVKPRQHAHDIRSHGEPRRVRGPPVICGDSHLGNFGFYASPEQDLVIDLNDFDEAHPGGWEWDLRRLVASIWVAGRQNAASEQQRESAVLRCVAGYRAEVRELASTALLPDDVVFLQLKQARRSVLARHVHGGSAWHAHQGQRVVEYQQALQTVSDPLLGWTTVSGHQYYVRQFRNMKGSIALDSGMLRS